MNNHCESDAPFRWTLTPPFRQRSRISTTFLPIAQSDQNRTVPHPNRPPSVAPGTGATPWDAPAATRRIPLARRIICIKGAGEMASGIALRLFHANLRRIILIERPDPLAVRRCVAFSEAVYQGRKEVEGVTAALIPNASAAPRTWERREIPLIVDPVWRSISGLRADVVIDALVAKRNTGTRISEAPLVIGLGPGFTAGTDVHRVIETCRGHHLGRVIRYGTALPNTGIPGRIAGQDRKRVVRAPHAGVFHSRVELGDTVLAGDLIGTVDGHPVRVEIGGILRGLIRPGTTVAEGLKIGDVDPRGKADHCHTVSEKARAIGGGVLEAILEAFNR